MITMVGVSVVCALITRAILAGITSTSWLWPVGGLIVSVLLALTSAVVLANKLGLDWERKKKVPSDPYENESQ